MICGSEQGLATNICEGMKGNKKGKGFIDLRGITLLSFYHTTYNMAFQDGTNIFHNNVTNYKLHFLFVLDLPNCVKYWYEHH